ncbi:hypothetical protein [Metallibacterium scheffleri]|uniref:hypothetical protein n=1 Tax=Metallibacterium scheffleri TaxID=993689 RepID=UPI0010A09FBF|nr:hypothetical protein [Metallibacterium scheffleri]
MRILIIVAAVLLLAGCMNVGTDIKPSQLSALKPGVTTLAQVEAQLGKPNTVTHNAVAQRPFNTATSMRRPARPASSRSWVHS